MVTRGEVLKQVLDGDSSLEIVGRAAEAGQFADEVATFDANATPETSGTPKSRSRRLATSTRPRSCAGRRDIAKRWPHRRPRSIRTRR